MRLAVIGAALVAAVLLALQLSKESRQLPSGYCQLCGYPTTRDVRGVSVHEHCEAEHAAGRDPCGWFAFPAVDCD